MIEFKVGDIVTIHMTGNAYFGEMDIVAELLHTPVNAGDCFTFKASVRGEERTLVINPYCSEFVGLSKLEAKGN